MSKVYLDISINDLVEELSDDDNIVHNSTDVNNNSTRTDSDSDSPPNQKWQPKKWKLEYEKIVMMDLMGLKGYEIAEKMNCTPQHVYNILATDQAIEIQKALIGRVRKDGETTIVDDIQQIQKLTVSRLKKCLTDDEIFKESRLGFISRGIDVMKGTGEHLKNAPTNQVNNQFILPPSIADRFLEGLEKSDRARELLKNKGTDITKLIESGSEDNSGNSDSN